MAYTDTFTGTNGTSLEDYNVLWVPVTNADGIVINTNGIIGQTGFCAYYYNQTFNSKHYSKLKGVAYGTQHTGPAIRVQAGNNWYYCAAFKTSGTTFNGENIAGSASDWDGGQSILAVND